MFSCGIDIALKFVAGYPTSLLTFLETLLTASLILFLVNDSVNLPVPVCMLLPEVAAESSHNSQALVRLLSNVLSALYTLIVVVTFVLLLSI